MAQGFFFLKGLGFGKNHRCVAFISKYAWFGIRICSRQKGKIRAAHRWISEDAFFPPCRATVFERFATARFFGGTDFWPTDWRHDFCRLHWIVTAVWDYQKSGRIASAAGRDFWQQRHDFPLQSRVAGVFRHRSRFSDEKHARQHQFVHIPCERQKREVFLQVILPRHKKRLCRAADQMDGSAQKEDSEICRKRRNFVQAPAFEYTPSQHSCSETTALGIATIWRSATWSW